MEPEGSLLHSQVPATCPYPEPEQSSPWPLSHFLKIHPVGAGFIHSDSRKTYRNDEANRRLTQFFERAYEITLLWVILLCIM